MSPTVIDSLQNQQGKINIHFSKWFPSKPRGENNNKNNIFISASRFPSKPTGGEKQQVDSHRFPSKPTGENTKIFISASGRCLLGFHVSPAETNGGWKDCSLRKGQLACLSSDLLVGLTKNLSGAVWLDPSLSFFPHVMFTPD